LGQADRVRDKLATLGITEDDVRAAIQWARQ
jgi:cysteinyl-tRNA synthetase